MRRSYQRTGGRRCGSRKILPAKSETRLVLSEISHILSAKPPSANTSSNRWRHDRPLSQAKQGRKIHPLAVSASSISPTDYGSLIRSKGLHNRSDRASICQVRDNLHNDFRQLAQPCKHYALLHTKRF